MNHLKLLLPLTCLLVDSTSVHAQTETPAKTVTLTPALPLGSIPNTVLPDVIAPSTSTTSAIVPRVTTAMEMSPSEHIMVRNRARTSEGKPMSGVQYFYVGQQDIAGLKGEALADRLKPPMIELGTKKVYSIVELRAPTLLRTENTAPMTVGTVVVSPKKSGPHTLKVESSISVLRLTVTPKSSR